MALGNTATRIIVSIIAIPLILAACFYGKIPFLIFVLGIGLISFGEFSELVKNKSIYTNFISGFLSVGFIIINSYFNFINVNVLFIIITVILLLFELFRNKSSAIINVGVTLLGVFYIGLFSSTILEIREFFNTSEMFYSEGGFLIISIMVSIWVCDSAAFFLGTAFGKHKLFPRVSPNKSWEGAITGFVFAVIAMIAAKALVLDVIELSDAIII